MQVVCFHLEISILVLAGTARLAAATTAATERGGITCAQGLASVVRTRVAQISAGTEVRVRLNTALGTTLVGLLRHLEDLSELHPLVGLHRLLHVSEPLVCHFV